ncbi:MAG: hypothetical protein GWM91_16395, partial [Actinobacteria bacterium]|nr:hypothetical protein [Actinomycetota bacterium]NIX51885.1 hypothetical protein [Actinomycetota bacterium]
QDFDEDGLNDDVEINDTNTDPLEADSDGDGLSDGQEVAGIGPASSIGIGSGHAATSVDSAGTRMNIDTAGGTAIHLPAGTYAVSDFAYSTGAVAGRVQPFLAVGTGNNQYTVVWVGPTEDTPGSDDIVTASYGGETFSLSQPATVYAGFNADGPVVKFGGGRTDHNNPADFDITPGSDITSFTNANLGRSYAFEINVTPAGTDPLNPDTDGDGLLDNEEVGITLVLADFGSDGPNANGSPDGWDAVPNLEQDVAFSLTDANGAATEIAITARDDGFNPNNSGAPNAAQTVDGIEVPVEANNDYLFKIADQAGTEAVIEISGLPAGQYNLSLFEGRTTDSNQVAKIWVGDDPEPDSENTGSFANGSTTVTINVADGETVFYKHLEDGSGGLGGMIIRQIYSTDPLSRDTDGDRFPDAFEISEGFDPLDPEDFPELQLVAPSFAPIDGLGAGP